MTHTMLPASEAMFFRQEPVAHIVAFQERNRLARIERTCRNAIQSARR